jgi:hypothetical protein
VRSGGCGGIWRGRCTGRSGEGGGSLWVATTALAYGADVWARILAGCDRTVVAELLGMMLLLVTPDSVVDGGVWAPDAAAADGLSWGSADGCGADF